MASTVAVGARQGRRWMFGFAWKTRPSPVQPARLVSDEQISALVDAALALSQSRLHGHATVMSVEARERLLRLDWAVRSGGLVLAERAAARLVNSATGDTVDAAPPVPATGVEALAGEFVTRVSAGSVGGFFPTNAQAVPP